MPRNFDRETSEALSTLHTLIPADVATIAGISSAVLNTSRASQRDLLGESLEFQATLVADLVYARKFDDKATWNRCVGVYLTIWTDTETGAAFSETLRSHYHAIDQAGHKVIFLSICLHLSHQAKHTTGRDASEGDELLCDTLFSLAYGALLLLSHTTLRLIRGRRYGILGSNGSGKSTLMRQLRDGKVENFPSQDQLKCVMVEHSLQGEDGSLSVLDFIAAGKIYNLDILLPDDTDTCLDKALLDVPRARIRDQLAEVGFDDVRQDETVGGLSGGWKMKLELARAMLYNADLLLLDEVRFIL